MISDASRDDFGAFPPGPLRIRDGSVADAERIEAVHYSSREAVYAGRVADWPPAGPDRSGRIARWKKWLSDPRIVCLVGESASDIVGFCTVRASADEDATPAVAEMPTLYVRPDAWRLGYGRSLCTAGLERALLDGFEILTLWVLEMNERARAFYASMGFAADDVTKADVGSTEQLMARRYRIRLTRADD